MSPVGGVSTGAYAEPIPVIPPPLPALLYAGWRNVGPGGATGLRGRLSDDSWVDKNPYVSTKWWCRSVSASQAYPGTVWQITSDENADGLQRLYRSNDYGVTWTLVDPDVEIDANIESFDLRSLSSRGSDIYLGVHLADTATGVWKADAFAPTSWTHVGTLYPTGSGEQGFGSIWPASDRIWFQNDRSISSVNRSFFYTLSGTTSIVLTSNGPAVAYITGTPGLASRAWGVVGPVTAGDKKVYKIDDTVATDITPFANGVGSTFEWPFALDSDIVFVSYFDDSLNQSTLYRSANAGTSWSAISGISGDVGFWHGGVMSADQDNPNRVYAGGVSGNIWISTDAGLTFTEEYAGAHTFVGAPESMSAGYPLR